MYLSHIRTHHSRIACAYFRCRRSARCQVGLPTGSAIGWGGHPPVSLWPGRRASVLRAVVQGQPWVLPVHAQGVTTGPSISFRGNSGGSELVRVVKMKPVRSLFWAKDSRPWTWSIGRTPHWHTSRRTICAQTPWGDGGTIYQSGLVPAPRTVSIWTACFKLRKCKIYYMIWYLFTAFGFSPGGSTKIGKRQKKRRNNTQNKSKTIQKHRLHKIQN